MNKSLHILIPLLFFLLAGKVASGQGFAYEEFFHILPGDTVNVVIPNHNDAAIGILQEKKHGTRTITDIGSEYLITYVPNDGFVGRDTFQIMYSVPVGDVGEITTKSKRIVIKVSEFIPHDDVMTVYTTDEALSLDVLANDIVGSGLLSIIGLPVPSESDLTIAEDGQSILFNGSEKPVVEHLSYLVSNGTTKELGNLTLIVKDSTDATEDLTNVYFLKKNGTFEVYYPYQIVDVVTDPSNGSFTYNTDGFTFIPDSAYVGVDTVILSAGQNGEAVHTLIFNVLNLGGNNKLVADDYFYTIKNHSVSLDFLANDFLDALEVDVIDSTEHGSLVKQANGRYLYTPDNDFDGADVLTYRACEIASDVCEYGVVVITVSDFAPEDEVYLTTAVNTPIKISYPFPAAGFKLGVTTYPKRGTAIFNQQKNFVYNPNSDFVGRDSLKYKAELLSDPSVFYIVRVYIDVLDVEDGCETKCVWPGDHNDDGRVDMKDLLVLAPNVGQTGPERTAGSNDIWLGQGAEEWDLAYQNINLKYIDSDGDGVTGVADTTLLSNNYRKLHGFPVNKGINSLLLPFRLKSDKAQYQPGDTMHVSVSLGDETWPIENLKGYSVSFSFSDAFVDSTLQGELFQSSWVGANSKLLNLIKKPATGVLDFGSARIKGGAAVGHGEIGGLKSIIDEEIDGFRDDDGLVYGQIFINGGTLKLDNGLELRVAPQVLNIPILLPTPDPADLIDLVKVYPNPAIDELFVKTTERDNLIQSVQVYSITGQQVMTKQQDGQNKMSISLGHLPQGLYLVKTFTSYGVQVLKVEKI